MCKRICFYFFQVWFQNARAKHRRNQMKSDGDKPDKADNPNHTSDNIDDDKHKDSLSMSEITDSQCPILVHRRLCRNFTVAMWNPTIRPVASQIFSRTQ